MPRKSEKDMKNSETSDSDSEWTPSCEKKDTKKDVKKDTKNDAKKDTNKDGKNGKQKDMTTLEMQKFMNKIFPSKSGKERLKMLEENYIFLV